MNIDLAPEANHISKIKCEHRSDHSSLAACCELSFINYEIKTLRPHLHLHGGCWFQTVNCIDLEEAHSSEMCSIKYTWEQFPREFSESLCLLPLMLFGRSAAVCSVLQSLLVLCHCSLQATVHQPLVTAAHLSFAGLGHFAGLTDEGGMLVRTAGVFESAQTCKLFSEIHNAKERPFLVWTNSAEYQRSGTGCLLLRVGKHFKESSGKENVGQSRQRGCCLLPLWPKPLAVLLTSKILYKNKMVLIPIQALLKHLTFSSSSAHSQAASYLWLLVVALRNLIAGNINKADFSLQIFSFFVKNLQECKKFKAVTEQHPDKIHLE